MKERKKKGLAGKPQAALSDNARMAVLGIGGTVAAFLLFGGLGGALRSGPSEPFDAMPRASFIVATVDFGDLRRSPVYGSLLGKESSGTDPVRRALGLGALADACGFDPVDRVQRFAVSVPEEGERGEFGVAARVEVTRAELETCTKALAEQRGGKAETREVGSFVVLEDTSSATQGLPAKSLIAYGRGGLLVVGKGTWFDAMLGAADHVSPGARDSAEHVALRRSLTSHEGFAKPTILVTAILPKTLRERLKTEMGAELGAQDTSSAIMAGVLGVSAIGVAIHAGGSGQNVDASIELACDVPEACEAVEKLAQKKRKEWSGELTLRMVGFGPLLDSFEVKREGMRLRATASANADSLATTIERVMKLSGRRGAADAPTNAAAPRDAPAPGPRDPRHRRPSADETLPAKPDGG